ncbi:Ig-like domain-containing protein, partial [Microcoleus sp. S36a_B3]
MNVPTANKQIIFVDSSVQDYQSLIQNADAAQIFILNDKLSGIDQITNALATQKDIEAIHILSHGSPGSLKLGADTLNDKEIATFSTQIKQWGNALTENGDIHLYGCDVAAGEIGIKFVKELSELTRADVAASNNITGNAELGGDWNLEVETGAIETSTPLNPEALKSYNYILPATANLDSKAITVNSPQVTIDVLANDTGSSRVSVNSITTPPTNGTAIINDWIYVGGIFTTIGGQARNRIARLNSDGSVDATFDPNANNQVNAIAIDSSGNPIVGGIFTTIGGSTRNRIAKLNPSTGVADATFNPNAGGQVNAIAIDSSGNPIVGGGFTTIGGQPRNRIAKLNPATGAADATFNPNASSNVNAIAIDSSGNPIVGGVFSNIGGSTRNRIAKLNPSTGVADATFNPNANSNVSAIALDSSGNPIVGGAFTTIGGSTRNRIAKLNPSTGVADATFNPNASGQVLAIAIDSGREILYTPNANFNGVDTFQYTAKDSSGTSSAIAVTVLVNNSPTLDNSGTPILNPQNQNDSASTGTLISTIITNLGGTKITDPNTSAKQGIAISALDTANGTWQYTTDGTTWTNTPAVSATNTLLLASDANTSLRFVPNPGFNGTVTNAITFAAWDQITGSNGTTANYTTDRSTNTTSSVFSSATETANITVNPFPTITSVSAATPNGTYGIGTNINITVQFSAIVNVTGTPRLTLAGATPVANYLSGTGTNTLTFRYPIAAGDNTPDLDYLSTTALSLSGGTIKNATNGDAILTLPTPGAVNSLGANKALVIDTIPPTVALTSASPTTTNAPFLVIATFSENVTGFTATDVTVGNGTVSGFTTTSGTTYEFTVTPTASGAVTVNVPAATAIDTVGNNNTAATQLTRTADITAPTVTLTSASPTTTNAPFIVTATFSETVTGFAANDVTVGNGTVSGFTTTSGTTYEFTVTPTANGAVTVDIPAATAIDTVGNNNTAATQLTRTADITAPTVTLTSASPTTTNAPFLVIATFSENVTGFTATDVTVGNGTVSGFTTTSGTTYEFTVTPTANGAVTVDIPAATAIDTVGNNNTAATQLTRTADITPPNVTLTSASPTTTNAPFLVTATFSEDVTGFTDTDVTVANGTVSGFTGTGSNYSFTVTPTATGNVTVDIPASGATDTAGNNNTAATQLTRTADITPPNVTLTSASPTTTNAPFLVTATFSEDVTGFTDTDVTVANGTVSGFTGTGSNYSFTVTPTATGNVTVDIPAATAIDTVGNNNTAATQLTRTADITPPNVTLTSASPTTTNAPFLVTATFSEDVTGFTDTDVTVANGTVSGFTGTGSNYSFTVTPTATGNVTVDIPAATAIDTVGNNNTAATQLTRTADITAPTVALTSASPTTTNAPFLVTATFSEDVTGFTDTDVTVANGTVSGFTGTGSNYSFTVTPTANGNVTVDIPAATATDTVGNNNTAAAQLTRTADITAPTVALTSASPTTTNAPFLVTATFSEDVTGFTDTDVTVANGTVSGFTGTGSNYSFTVTPTATGNVTVDIPAATAIDTVGNNNTAATQLTRTADITPPNVTLTSA